MKHYFLLFLIITNFPFVSYGFSLLPTRFNLGYGFKLTSIYDYHKKENSDEEKTYSPCVIKETSNTGEDHCSHKMTNWLEVYSLSYDPFYLYGRLGVQFQFFYREFDKTIFDYPKKNLETKINFQSTSLGFSTFFVFGDKSLGKNKVNEWSLIVGAGSQYFITNNLILTNAEGSIKPKFLQNKFSLLFTVRYKNFYLGAEGFRSLYEIPKESIGNQEKRILEIYQTDGTLVGYTFFF